LGPRRDEGSQHLRRPAAGSRDQSGRGGCHLLWPWGIHNRGEGPRAASTSRSARSMLPAGRGACIATATGDGVFRAPPGAGPRRVKAVEVPRAAQFAALCVGTLMRRGPPAPSVHRAGALALFLLPGGRPRRLAPELADPVAAEEAE
jgi:hypothetical protein